MPCAACGHANRAHAKFCEACGAPLSAPSDAAPAPRTYTPRHLIDRILASRGALQGERKPVTVLFADVQGSMALAERVDPEEWHAIMNQFFAILSEGVHRFEGTVNQYTGDGIMALFGAPLAHEDHAQRACYAALHLTGALREYAQRLRRERGLQFLVRMGLNSGEVVVGAIGDDLRMDYTAQGHTVGLAARMEQLCEPGRVYLTQHTADLAAGYFDLEDLGLFTIKGVSAPLRAFALLAQGPLRTRLDLARTRGLSRFIGRDVELAQLEALASAGSGAQPTVVAIIADAGFGKSRLCAEYCERWRARGASVVETQALAHGAALPYLPVLTLLRRLLDIGERDAPETVRQKTAGGVLLLGEELRQRLPILFDFLGVPDAERGRAPTDPESRIAQLVDTCVALLRARSGRQPAVVLVEDLHWFDAASDVFLRRLVAALAGQPAVLILNARPEYDTAWLLSAGCTRISLQPLGDAAIAELLGELLGSDPSLGDLHGRLLARAAGNPFFAEELVQALAQSGVLQGAKGAYTLGRAVDAAAIPTSVRAVLAARIDRLAPRDKEVLHAAAVIGKEFDEPVLRAVTGLSKAELAAALRDLASAELVFEGTAYPVSAYAFKHPLTQEVAYGTQLAAQRVRQHAAVAAALAPPADGLDRVPAVLVAYHWEKAGVAWEAAQWQYRAARELSGTDTREALARLRRAVTLLGELPEPAPAAVALALQAHDDLLRLGTIAGLARDDAESVFNAGRALAERAGDRAALTRLYSTFGELLFFTGHGADAQRYLREANALAHDVDDAAVQLTVLVDKAQTAFWAGRLRDVLKYIERALPGLHNANLGKEIPVGLWGEAFGTCQRGIALSFLGRRREGAADLERAVQLADEHGSLEGRCVARQFAALGALASGEESLALTYARTAVELAVRAGSPFLERLGRASLGSVYAMSANAAEGIRMLEELADERYSAELGAAEWMLLPTLADALRRNGDLPRALVTARRAVEIASANDALTSEATAQLTLAATLVEVDSVGQREAIEAALARAAALIDESGAEFLRPRLHATRASWARLLGDLNQARCELVTAERQCREMGMDELADQVARELAGGEWGVGA